MGEELSLSIHFPGTPMLRIFVFYLALFAGPLPSAFGSFLAQTGVHLVQVQAKSSVPNSEAQILCVPEPPAGLDYREWMRVVESTTPIRFKIPRASMRKCSYPRAIG